jgi:hypothetical protein
VHGRLRHRPNGVNRRALLRAASTAVEQLRKNSKDILPEKRLQDRGAAGGPRGSGDKRLARHPVNKGTRPNPNGKS